jgi:hypothetical protein
VPTPLRRFISVLFPLFLSLVLAASAEAVTWAPVQPLTSSGDTMASPGALAVVGTKGVGVAYRDVAGGHTHVFFRRSTDGGATWKTRIQLDTGTSPVSYPDHAVGPSLASSGSIFDAAWLELDSTGHWHVRYARSLDSGATWGAQKALSPAIDEPSFPRIARDATDRVAVVWTEASFSASDPFAAKVVVRVSTDGGLNFGSRRILASNGWHAGDPTFPGGEYTPVVAIGNGIIHVVYYFDGTTLRYRNSSTEGVAWSAIKTMTTSADLAMDMAAAGDAVLIGYTYLYNDPISHTTKVQVVYRRSADAGATWYAKLALAPAGGNETYGPVVSQRGGTWRVVFARINATHDGAVVIYRESADAVTWTAASSVSPTSQGWGLPEGVGYAGAPIVLWQASSTNNLYERHG